MAQGLDAGADTIAWHLEHDHQLRRHPATILRLNGRLHHIGLGRTHARTHVVLLIDHDHVRLVHATTGELLRDLTIDTSRDYQPTGRPSGHPRKPQ